MKTIFKFLLVCILLSTLQLIGYACKCKDTVSVFQSYLNASVMYVGKVVAIRDSLHYQEVVFEVSQNLKQTFSKKTTLRVGHTSCDWHFKLDSVYVVYANKDEHGFLHTNLCTRTKLFSEAGNDLKELHAHDLMDCIVLLPVETSEICTEHYEPVCGCDNKTYGNPCIAHNNGVNHWIWGECRKLKK
jgi:hypothetical protein